jgi:S-adenosyl methyltransferase
MSVGQVNPEMPNAARMYDYYLGGAHNFPADRQLGEQARTVLPCVNMVARLNRSFLRRAVVFMVEQGITQFLDLGSGIPTVGNVHEIAQGRNPDARVVYVDYEPIAVAHSELILAEVPNAAVVGADIRQPEAILDSKPVRELLNLDEPIGLLMVGVLLFIPDSDDPGGLVRTYREVCAPGSYLALSHITDDEADPLTREQVHQLVEVYQAANEHIYLRDRKTFTDWFDGTELVDPGVTLLADWRPDGGDGPDVDSPARTLGYGGVSRIA